jgi:hypothetical protein
VNATTVAVEFQANAANLYYDESRLTGNNLLDYQPPIFAMAVSEPTTPNPSRTLSLLLSNIPREDSEGVLREFRGPIYVAIRPRWTCALTHA